MSYSVRLQVFEGPLDLLLHLIQKAQIDIYDIPIAEITEQYLAYVYAMADLDLEVASEFVTLAATLLSIKMRMLLPAKEASGTGTAEDVPSDPRRELVQALLEYSAFKQAADTLRALEEDMARKYPRPHSEPEEQAYIDSGPLKATLWDLISAMRNVLSQTAPAPPIEIRLETYSFRSAFFRILRTLRRHPGGQIRFVDLFGEKPLRQEVVVVFLAVLELCRQGRIRAFQESPYGQIVIEAGERRSSVERPA